MSRIPATKKSFFSQSVWTSFASIAFGLNSFITNKLISIYFGPQGLTFYAHFQNIIAVFTTLPNDGINRGMIKLVSDKHYHTSFFNIYASAIIVSNLACFLVVLISIVLFSSYFIPTDFQFILSSSYLIIIGIGIFFHVIGLTLIAYLMAIQHVIMYSIFSIINNILGITLAIYFCHLLRFDNLLAALSIYHLVVVVILFSYIFNQQTALIKNFYWNFDKSTFRLISQYLLIALSLVLFSRLVDLFVRNYVINHFNTYQTGLWQSVVKISDGYTTLFSAALGMLFFSKISSLLSDKILLKKFMWQSLAFIFIISFVCLSILYVFREFWLVVFYKDEFKKAAYLLDFQLLGDIFKFPSYLLAYLLLAELRTTTYIFTQAISALVYVVLIYILLPTYDLYALPMAHGIRFIFYFLMYFYISRKTLFS